MKQDRLKLKRSDIDKDRARFDLAPIPDSEWKRIVDEVGLVNVEPEPAANGKGL